MKAMLLDGVVDVTRDVRPLRAAELPVPVPSEDELLIRVKTCGVCHTELDEIEGRTPPSFYPVVPGHQAVGVVEKTGIGCGRFKKGDRVGVAWVNSACGRCEYCNTGRENLCREFKATGRDANGGYAEYMTVGEGFAHSIPGVFTDEEAAPLLCAGAIGYRSLVLSGLSNGQVLGLSGFGGSAHLVLKMAAYKYPQSKVVVFARSPSERAFALDLGAFWAGGHEETPPCVPDTIIDTTPAWSPILHGLRNLKPGGRLVVNAIRKESSDSVELAGISYAAQLWMEKEIKSVANVTRRDVGEFLALAAEASIKPDVQLYDLSEANTALVELKERRIRGAKVLRI